jgi:predicted Rossmann fold flavoprotein
MPPRPRAGNGGGGKPGIGGDVAGEREERDWDVVVLGAGAAGLFAAIRAAECGAQVLLVEKNRKPGVKILISGGTRCNLTNARGLRSLRMVSGPVDPAYDPRLAQGARSIQQAFGAGGAFLGPALRSLSVDQTVSLFEAEGLPTKVEANGKVFPASDRAVDVLDALLRRFDRSGAALRCNAPVGQVEPRESGFRVSLPDGAIQARRVIVAVGGQSYPGCGTTGDGYSIARRFGHTIVEPRPALVPLRVDAEWVPTLKGLTIPDVVATIHDAAGSKLLQRREALLFAHFGLTGPAILDVSRAVARYAGEGRPELAVDFAPELQAEALERELQQSARIGRRAVVGLLPVCIPRRLAEALIAEANIPVDRMGPELARDERRRILGVVKGLRLPVAGTLGFGKAEVTSGGVSLHEVDPHTLESRKQPGLFFAGEVLDLDGLIGGYNFQSAFSTGWLAGEKAAAAWDWDKAGN